jgi:hypothetical protein
VNYVTYYQSYVTYLGLIITIFVFRNTIGLPNTYKMKRMAELNLNWADEKSELIKRFALLTDCGKVLNEEKKEEIIRRLQVKFGKTREQIKEIIPKL